MAKIVAIANQKGGVGKTTTAINLSSSLAVAEQKTLIVDIDPQANTTSGLGYNKNDIEKSVYDVLTTNMPVEEAIIETDIEYLHLLPSNINLVGAEIELVNLNDREFKLKKGLESVSEFYDYIIIDCPPSLGLLTINTLTCAQNVIIPIQCEYYALEGLSQLTNTINLVHKSLNPKLEIHGILLTMYDGRLNLSRQVADEARKYFAEKVYDTVINRNVRLSEAPSFGKPILLYDVECKGAQNYIKFAKEVLAR
ncbi:MAG: ParA family protein [candidate division Zixibacteria bacterium]|nr:ParA family protein [candidate division Zixibacteria bacterium]